MYIVRWKEEDIKRQNLPDNWKADSLVSPTVVDASRMVKDRQVYETAQFAKIAAELYSMSFNTPMEVWRVSDTDVYDQVDLVYTVPAPSKEFYDRIIGLLQKARDK